MHVDLFVDFSTLCHQPAYSLIVQCQFWTAGVSRVCFRSDGKAPGKMFSSAACSFFLVLQMVPRVYTCQPQAGTLTELHSWAPSFSAFSLLPIYLFFQINFSFHWIVFFFHYWSISPKLRCLTWLKPWLGCSVQSPGQLSVNWNKLCRSPLPGGNLTVSTPMSVLGAEANWKTPPRL